MTTNDEELPPYAVHEVVRVLTVEPATSTAVGTRARDWDIAAVLDALPEGRRYGIIKGHIAADRATVCHDDDCAIVQDFSRNSACDCSAAFERRRALEAEVKRLDVRRRDGRQLLARLVRSVQKDRNSSHLDGLMEQVADYLNRTADPNDLLRRGLVERPKLDKCCACENSADPRFPRRHPDTNELLFLCDGCPRGENDPDDYDERLDQRIRETTARRQADV